MVVKRAAHITALFAALVAAFCAASAAAALPARTVVRVPFPRYDGTLTPYTFELGYPLVTLVYDTLLWRDANGVPQPWLARSLQRTAGGRRLTITLQKGARWQDGRPLTAEDVAFTFRYVASHFHPRFTPELADVERVRATDQLTVTIDLRHVSLGFEDQPLSDVPILPKHLWQGLAPGLLAPPGLPVGSGPYRLVSAKPSTGYVFDANDAYFKGAPRVRQIRVPIVQQEQRAYDDLLQGRADMLPFGLPNGAAQNLGGAPGIAISSGPLYSGTALVLNLRRSPFANPAARRAVAQGLDLQQIASNAGPAAAADQGYIDPVSPWASGTILQRFDPSAARAAVTGLRLPLIHVLAANNDPVRLEAGRQVVLDLRRVGIKATLTTVSSAALGQALGENGSAPHFDAAIDSTSPLASYDPDFLAALFGSSPVTSPLNVTGYRSHAFDALAQRVASAPDQESRRQAARAALGLLAHDLPVIPLFFSQGTFAYRSAAYAGWVFVKGTGILDKRSFLAAQPRLVSGTHGGGSPAPTGSGSGLGLIDIASLVVVAIVVLLAGAAARARRAGERR
ncbi:MAG: ABC transporter substrate-binding protein [Actinomycetota bacterium]|nr:ABC transporter substrate-binding protein [Actinomycetota bacterium]